MYQCSTVRPLFWRLGALFFHCQKKNIVRNKNDKKASRISGLIVRVLMFNGAPFVLAPRSGFVFIMRKKTSEKTKLGSKTRKKHYWKTYVPCPTTAILLGWCQNIYFTMRFPRNDVVSKQNVLPIVQRLARYRHSSTMFLPGFGSENVFGVKAKNNVKEKQSARMLHPLFWLLGTFCFSKQSVRAKNKNNVKEKTSVRM